MYVPYVFNLFFSNSFFSSTKSRHHSPLRPINRLEQTSLSTFFVSQEPFGMSFTRSLLRLNGISKHCYWMDRHIFGRTNWLGAWVCVCTKIALIFGEKTSMKNNSTRISFFSCSEAQARFGFILSCFYPAECFFFLSSSYFWFFKFSSFEFRNFSFQLNLEEPFD